MRMYGNLQELTGQESGAVKYDDGEIWIGNWSNIDGLPRVLEPIGTFGLGETIMVESTYDAPDDVVEAMKEHAIENGDEPTGDYNAWRLEGREVVVTCNDWN